jgi:hypothetical protein
VHKCDAFALLQLGILLQDKGDWRRATDQFRRATEVRPNYVEAHLKLSAAISRIRAAQRARWRNGESSKRRREREDSIELLRGGGSAESGRCTGHNLRSFQCGTMLRLGNVALRSTYRTVRIVQPDPLPVLPFTPPERAPEAHRSRPRVRSPKKERLIRPLWVLSLI